MEARLKPVAAGPKLGACAPSGVEALPGVTVSIIPSQISVPQPAAPDRVGHLKLSVKAEACSACMRSRNAKYLKQPIQVEYYAQVYAQNPSSRSVYVPAGTRLTDQIEAQADTYISEFI
jgi:hypothetical protein